METVSLANHFLIAMPAMDDPSVSRTLTFICEHTAEGAIGIIVNRPTEMNLAGLFDRVSIPLDDQATEARLAGQPVYSGGPVQTDRGFVLHRPAGDWQSSLSISDSIALTATSAPRGSWGGQRPSRADDVTGTGASGERLPPEDVNVSYAQLCS